MNTAPIALFTYNRLDCLKQTVEALKANELASESDLYIFSDGPKPNADSAAVFGVRTYLKTITGFRSIHIKEAEKNQGLANSIIAGVTEIVNRFGRIIVLEDDLVTSPYFLRFMNEALVLYENEEKVAGILGYCPFEGIPMPETYFTHEVGCLGWATWAMAWRFFECDSRILLQKFNTQEKISQFNHYDSYPYLQMLQDQADGKVDSWAIRWYASVFLNGMLGLQPGRNMVSHIGYGTGTHCQGSTLQAERLSANPPKLEKLAIAPADYLLKTVYVDYNRKTFGGIPVEDVIDSPKKIRHIFRKTVKCLLPYGIVRIYQKYLRK